MADKETYIPVSCDLHSQFELLIMQHRLIELYWRDGNGNKFIDTVKAKDIQTSSGEEFLIVENQDSNEFIIRLDHIQSFNEP